MAPLLPLPPTRYLALACIVSVMLGVATLIVVNSVMKRLQHEAARTAFTACSPTSSLESHEVSQRLLEPAVRTQMLREIAKLAGRASVRASRRWPRRIEIDGDAPVLQLRTGFNGTRSPVQLDRDRPREKTQSPSVASPKYLNIPPERQKQLTRPFENGYDSQTDATTIEARRLRPHRSPSADGSKLHPEPADDDPLRLAGRRSRRRNRPPRRKAVPQGAIVIGYSLASATAIRAAYRLGDGQRLSRRSSASPGDRTYMAMHGDDRCRQGSFRTAGPTRPTSRSVYARSTSEDAR